MKYILIQDNNTFMNICSIISADMPSDFKKNLSARGFTLIEIQPCAQLPAPIATHPDIQLFIADGTVFCHSDIRTETKNQLSLIAPLVVCTETLGRRHEQHAAFNALYTGAALIHNISFTAGAIIDHMKKKNVPLIHCAQGYARCSALPLGKTGIITSDRGIIKQTVRCGIESLEIFRGSICLPGHEYGFIGGTAGVHDSTVYFAGNLDLHPDARKIHEFLERYSMKADSLGSGMLIDLGSIFFIEY